MAYTNPVPMFGRAKRHKSKSRGGASASPRCKSALSSCMTGVIRGGGSLRTAGKKCMSAFNNCRLGGKRKKRGKRR
jgi:hypothetical protein